MFGLSHCRGIAVISSFKTQLPFDVLPEWKEVRGPAARRAGRRAAATRTCGAGWWRPPSDGDYGRGHRRRGPQARLRRHARARHGRCRRNPTVAEVAAAAGRRSGRAHDRPGARVRLRAVLRAAASTYGDRRDVCCAIMRHPRTVMTFSDSGAHVSQITDSLDPDAPARPTGCAIAQEFTLEEAVRMITLAPAARVGLPRPRPPARGAASPTSTCSTRRPVAPGMPTVVARPARRRHAGSCRRPQGFRATVVNGEVLLPRRRAHRRLPGRLVRVWPRSGVSRSSTGTPAPTATGGVTVTRLAPALGAEVGGVDARAASERDGAVRARRRAAPRRGGPARPAPGPG